MQANSPSNRRPGRRAYILATLFALALVMLPFLFWYDTWFGRKLTDSQIDRYIQNAEKPRRMQQALVQLGERMARHQPGVERWYPRVIELSRNDSAELRQTAAWLMGQDTRYQPFHAALPPLLEDSSPMVRRNAALSLAAFLDPAARPVLRSMLRSSTVFSPYSGTVKYRLKVGQFANPGTLLAHIGTAELRAPLPGEVRDIYEQEGAEVKTGQRLLDLSPDENHVWEALRALLLVGDRLDVEDVQRYARGAPGMSPKIQKQAVLTLHEVEGRIK